MPDELFRAGPLAGEPTPRYGGRPDGGCNGCIDCCHLPEISLTDEEAERLRARYCTLEAPLGALSLSPDPSHPGWQIMQGPCVFRRVDSPREAGGCRIYEDRPGGCVTFTCSYLLELRRRG
jgi:Fe-S-cluster containining protein